MYTCTMHILHIYIYIYIHTPQSPYHVLRPLYQKVRQQRSAQLFASHSGGRPSARNALEFRAYRALGYEVVCTGVQRDYWLQLILSGLHKGSTEVLQPYITLNLHYFFWCQASFDLVSEDLGRGLCPLC